MEFKDLHNNFLDVDPTPDNLAVTSSALAADQWYVEKTVSDEINGYGRTNVSSATEAWDLEDDGDQLWACDPDPNCCETEEDEVMWHPVWIAR